mgnify:CR=1 FL=1
MILENKDCLEFLSELDTESVDLVLTDPPYYIGFDGGKLKKLSDTYIHIPTERGEYGPVEDFQLMINHILAHWFQKNLKR